jgi:hypothetical protein
MFAGVKEGDAVKRILGIAGGICAIVLIPTLVLAARGDGGGRVDVQGFAWTTDVASTSSTEWVSIPGIRDVSAACPERGGASATVSLEVQGGSGPVEVRVRMNEIGGAVPIGEKPPGRVMRPGPVTIGSGSAGADVQSHSYTFVASRIPGDHGATFDVQWRSPGGTTATIRKATLRVLWNQPSGPCA